MSDPLSEPLFSICVPQFNRTSFLLQSLDRLRDQVNTDFEVCISDGGSTDGRAAKSLSFFKAQGCDTNTSAAAIGTL